MGQATHETIQSYLRQLTPQARGRLLAELERRRLCDDELPGSDSLLTELRKELGEAAPAEKLDPPARHFFQPLEPFLINRPPEQAPDGRISRGSLTAIWDVISRELMHAAADAYAVEISRRSTGNHEAAQAARAFQNKAVKYLDGVLATARGPENLRTRLAFYTTLPGTFEDFLKVLCVLKARDALAEFEKRLPHQIKSLADEQVDEMWKGLDAFASRQAAALPFALMLVSRHLKMPWQLIRLATKAVDSKDAAEIAATPYAVVVSMVLDQLDEKVAALRSRLRIRAPIAKDVLVDIYDTEYALRVRIELSDDSPWGQRLDATMKTVSDLLQAEMQSLPASLHHVLGSRQLKHHESLAGRLTWWAWKCRDTLHDGVAFCRQLASRAQSFRQ